MTPNQIRGNKVRLLQVDVAVKDNRSGEGGWVFGTFQFDKSVAAQDPWRQITPVTLMWGNDPTFTPANYDPAQAIFRKDSWINGAAPVVVYRSGLPQSASAPHVLGWAGRGNGPVDNPVLSCLSCHGVAEQPYYEKHVAVREQRSGKATLVSQSGAARALRQRRSSHVTRFFTSASRWDRQPSEFSRCTPYSELLPPVHAPYKQHFA